MDDTGAGQTRNTLLNQLVFLYFGKMVFSVRMQQARRSGSPKHQLDQQHSHHILQSTETRTALLPVFLSSIIGATETDVRHSSG